ncbi:hypothetical protein ACN20G_10480 [Streptomyces sp. BI20]|uniref:hypothetical protein n=1 Tax=Streptomyces sp. BI20 TaxID=3403460 RepID=UPI003C73BB03
MTTALLTPIQADRANGATATSDAPRRTGLGGVLRAAKVFAGTAVGVVIFGEYAEDAGIVRR